MGALEVDVVLESAPDDGELERFILEYARKHVFFTAKEINRLLSPRASAQRITRVLRKLERGGLIVWVGRKWVYLGD